MSYWVFHNSERVCAKYWIRERAKNTEFRIMMLWGNKCVRRPALQQRDDLPVASRAPCSAVADLECISGGERCEVRELINRTENRLHSAHTPPVSAVWQGNVAKKIFETFSLPFFRIIMYLLISQEKKAKLKGKMCMLCATYGLRKIMRRVASDPRWSSEPRASRTCSFAADTSSDCGGLLEPSSSTLNR